MAEPSRYKVGGDEIATDGVLKNKLNITDQATLEDTETILLQDTYTNFFKLLEENKLDFNIKLLFKINEYFLEPLYSWAGKIRAVEISKDNVMFCASSQIQKELVIFGKQLVKNIPDQNDSQKLISEKLAFIHCELNAIHPFREGNGRSIRLFLDLLAVNTGFSIIDFKKTSQIDYIAACIGCMQKDYSKMQKIIYKGLKRAKK